MFQKIVNSINGNGDVTTEKREQVAAEDVQADMARELRRIRQIAQTGRTRITSVEETMTTLVIIYGHGAVKVYHWVAVQG